MVNQNPIEASFDELRVSTRTKILFFSKAQDDWLRHKRHGKHKEASAMIRRRARQNARWAPYGISTPLRPPLHLFAKIKQRKTGLRILYRPAYLPRTSITRMEILIIGSRENFEVYKMAIERVPLFLIEMETRVQEP